jgi:hypothetical protein
MSTHPPPPLLPELGLLHFPPLEIRLEHLYIEAGRELRDGVTDVPEADTAERGVRDVGGGEQPRAPSLPLVIEDILVPFDRSPGRGHQERPGVVRGRIGEQAGRMPDRKPSVCGGLEVDVIVSDGEGADDVEVR